jgi:hypothetical protein
VSGRRRRLAGLCLAAAAWAVPATAQPAPAADPVLARAFDVRYRPLLDAAELIEPLLSASGKVTWSKRLNTLVVEDHVSVLDKIAALIASYDLPPRNVEVTFSLFLGTDRRDTEPGGAAGRAGLSSEVRGVLETLGDVTKWSSYDALGSRSVTGAEGDEVVATLSDEYRVVFAIESVHEGHGVIKFRQLSLQRLLQRPDGTTSIADLYTASLGVGVDKLTVVGAASDPDSKRALFLTLQARPRPR